ncbi:hypothetical protein [Sphingomonas sp. S2-65]|uniref:hypothetical protein n=1 Tax=Sphingomonas sp. S2-65 TaxID=2903960 RepID=UPI001F216275|nr:hypothetical protein [Sphingomonas sp. S2-65]UYY58282.1 hypothetical protein LZ586_16725 [Sphingomonas sp. S2-65]
MTEADRLARKRYYLMSGVNLAAAAGAVLGLLIMGRSQATEHTLLGGALILASLYVMAVVPRAMARKWKTPAP